MSQLLNPCVNLKVLDMNLCGNMRSSELASLFTHNLQMCKSLEYLDICETPFSVHSMATALMIMPELQYLDISDTEADDELLFVISNCNTNLKYISLTRCINVSDAGIELLVEKCKQLETISISDCPYIDNHAFIEEHNIRIEVEGEDGFESLSDD
ncbi:Dynein regulatory complex subunit 6 [Coemansia brasiliensis]|uniref:Dynein regulatory complex subunit 6 n=1 Tax=Coemansia brasiliensis TaxID=2650707 RepID=A0A9W8I7X4_9FUNG|nr:Dynein regulatory complex subunit 6 [Coemansia brasiliensis]